MSIYRKKKKDAIFESAEGMRAQMIVVVPKMYWVLLAGILLLVITVLSWAVFGEIDETVSVTGLYAPGLSEEGEVIAFVPLSVGKTLQPGMKSTIGLVGYQSQKMGNMQGKITYVEKEVTGIEEMRSMLKDDTLVNPFVQNGPVMLVVFSVDKNPASANGYAWTHRAGGNIVIQDFTYTGITVIKDSVHPITLGMSGLAEFFSKN